MRPLAIASLLVLLAALASAGGAPPDVLVVVNASDPDSVAIGERYRSARSIPERNVCAVDVPKELATDLATYKSRIEGPIRDHLLRRDLRGRIDYVVCARGIPILVRVGGGAISTAALLELMDTDVSGRDRPPVPVLANPYRHGPEAFSHSTAYEGRHLYLVTFLTGYTAEDAKALVDRALAAERAPPESPAFYFQDASGNARVRDGLYEGAVAALREKGLAASHHPSGAGAVTDRKDVMVWMSGGSYSGLNEKAVASNTYLPGALVDMLESFGAVPGNFDPAGQPSQAPVTWFVRHGITGIHGAVAEPYAHTFPDTSLPLRYVQGFNLAEAFHGSLPFLYWQSLVIGDPLCAPFARRPVVKVDGIPARASGAVELRIGTEGGVEACEVLVDGLPAGRLDGPRGSVTLDTHAFRNGPRSLLVVARGPAPLRTAGWWEGPLAVENDALAPIAARIEGGRILVDLDRPPRAGEPAPVTVTGPAGAVPGRTETDGAILVFVPEVDLPAGAELRVEAAGGERTVRTSPAALRIEAPEEARAGEAVAVRVTALDGAGAAVAGGGLLALRAGPPPVTLAEGEGPVLEASVTLTRAGPVTLTAEERRSGVKAEARIRVRAGDLAGFDVRPPGKATAGVPFDVRVRALDRFRNRVEDWRGRLRLAASEDNGASIRGTVTLGEAEKGDGVIAGVTLSKPGRCVLAVVDDAGGTLGQGQVQVEPTRLLSWLILGPLPAPEGAGVGPDLLGGEAEVVAAKGSVHAGRVWREHQERREPVDVGAAAGGREDAVVYALGWVELGDGAEGAGLRLGHGPPVALFVNGRSVHAAEADGPGAEKPEIAVKEPGLRKGWNRILVKTVRRKEHAAFTLRLVDASGKDVPALRVALAPPEGLPEFGLSGRVRSGDRGVPGARVLVEGPRRAEATTDGAGRYALGGLPPGAYRVTATAPGLTVTPAGRDAKAGPANAEDVDFEAADPEPPEAAILAPRPNEKVGRWVRVVVEAKDNVGVAGVRLEVDGAAVGDEAKAPPFEIRLDTKPLGDGTHEIRAVARDGAGNATRSDPVKVRVDLDTTAPRIRIVDPRRGRTIVGRWMDVNVEVRDDDEVASLEILVDGKRVAGPFEGVRKREERVDVGGLDAGERTLTVRATDVSGNVGEASVPFRKR